MTCAMRPAVFLSPCRKKDSAAPGGRKKGRQTRSTSVQFCGSASRSSNMVQLRCKVHACLRHRPQCCLDRRPRAAGRGGVESRSEVRLSVSETRVPRPRLTVLAATPVAPLGSPPLRGVQRTRPLVAFLWSARTISFHERKETVLDLRRSVVTNTIIVEDKSKLLSNIKRRGCTWYSTSTTRFCSCWPGSSC